MPTFRGLRRREVATLAFLAAIWGASFLFIKVAVKEVGPAGVSASRLVIATLAITGWLRLRRGPGAVRRILAGVSPTDALVLAVTGSAVPFLLIAWSETRITSSLAGILYAATPLFTAALALCLAAPDRIRGWRTLGLLLGFGGVALVAGGDLAGGALAIGAMLLAAFLYSISAHFARRRFAGRDPQTVALVQTLAGACVAIPAALLFTRPHAFPSAAAVGSLLALGVGGTAIGYLLYYSLVGSAGPQHAVAVSYLAPVAAVIYGRVLLGERLAISALVGMAVIIAGQIVTSTPARHPAEEEPAPSLAQAVPETAA